MEKINYKRINTENLLKVFCAYKDENLSIEDGGLRLGQESIYEPCKVLIDDAALNIRDIALDECDLIYVIDSKDKNPDNNIPENKIFTYEKETGSIIKLGCEPGVMPVELDSISATGIDKDTIYIARSTELIALARNNFQIRWILSEGLEKRPLNRIIDIAVDYKGIIYALEEGNENIIEINRSGKVFGFVESGLSQPTDITVDGYGVVYVLDGKRVSIFTMADSGKWSLYKTIDFGFSAKGLAVDPAGQIFIGRPGPGDEDPGGVKKAIYRLDRDGNPAPIWSYTGATGKLASDSGGNLYVVNHERTKLAFLRYRDRAVYRQNERKSYSGTYVSKPIDSQADIRTSGTRWHRFLLEGKFEKGTKVEFFYYISDELKDHDAIMNLPDNGWHKGLPDATSIQGEEKRDALFMEDIRGRYLWFKINLIGSETLTPVITSVTVIFPRTSYLDYLPAIYQEENVSRDFLERFLSIFESIFSDIDFNIEHSGSYFDSFGTPPEFLSWLGSWLSVSMDEKWDENKKRRLIREAVSLYKKRGTREGLEKMIELCTGLKISIVENFSAVRPPKNEECKLPGEAQLLFFPPHDAMTVIKKLYLFIWDGIPGNENDNYRLKRYLNDKFLANWVETAQINKINENTIQVFFGEKYILLTLNPENTRVSLIIYDGRTYGLIAKFEDGTLNIYEETEEVTRLSDVLFRKEPFCFCVFLDGANLDESAVDMIKRIIEEQKPAHTCYGIKVLEPWFHLDMHTYLGVNTRLSEAAFILGKASVIGRDTVLYDREQAGQVRVHSRVGMDTKLT